MSTNVLRFQLFSVFLHHFDLVKLATSSVRVNVRIMAARDSTRDLTLESLNYYHS